VDDDLKTIRVLNRPDTIRAVGVSERTWERLEAAGDVPPKTRLSEGRIGYRVVDIEDWLDRRREGESWKQLGDVAQEVCADVRDHQIKMQAELSRREKGGNP
jgi:predicted DNA-binding transcriptional regulator AlpA